MSQKRRLSFSDDDADDFDLDAHNALMAEWDAHNAHAAMLGAAASNAVAHAAGARRYDDDDDSDDEDWTLLIDSQSAGTDWERYIPNSAAEALMVARWVDMTPYVASLYREYEEDNGRRPDGAYLSHKTTGEVRRLPTRADTWMIWINGNHESDMQLENVRLLLDGDEDLNNQFHEFVQAYAAATDEHVDSIELTRDDERIVIDPASVLYEEEFVPAPPMGLAALVAAADGALDDIVEALSSRLRGPPDQA
jgi:hypothetical protein